MGDIQNKPGILHRLRRVFARERIDDAAALTRALQAMAGKTGQSVLFGYLKARMGTRYPVIFQDPEFQPGLRAAQEAVFAACLADLTVFAGALMSGGQDPDRALAAGLSQAARQAAAQGGLPHAQADAFLARLLGRFAEQDWALAGQGEGAFTESPNALVDAAPVIADYKREDRVMILNSVRFHWIEVRRRFRARLDCDRVAADLRNNAAL